MGTTIGIILIVIALANDCFTAWLNWRSDLNNGKGPSGITGVPAAFYTAGACLIRPSLATSSATSFLLTLGGAVVFHILFILTVTRVIHLFAGTRKKRDFEGRDADSSAPLR